MTRTCFKEKKFKSLLDVYVYFILKKKQQKKNRGFNTTSGILIKRDMMSMSLGKINKKRNDYSF